MFASAKATKGNEMEIRRLTSIAPRKIKAAICRRRQCPARMTLFPYASLAFGAKRTSTGRREEARIGGDGHALRFARLQDDAVESKETHPFVASSFGQINLRHIGTLTFTRIGHGQRGGDGFAATHVQAAVGKRCVAALRSR